MTGDSCITIDGVTKSFGSVVAVDDVSLSVASGTYHCLLGPNGSGKTTLLRLVLGLQRPDRGQIDVAAATVGCGFQQPNFYPGLTVRENIDVFAGLVGADNSEWTETVVEELRLTPALDRRAGSLSGGYARKLDLTLALVNRPDVLLLDEPLGALDDVSTTRLLSFLDAYVGDGNTILLSTHHVTAFEPYLDRVTLMHDGRVLVDQWIDALELGEHDSLQSFYVESILAREDGSLETTAVDDRR